jgi:hypothetical protein
MNAMTRPLATLLAAALVGAALWLVGHWDRQTTGGYWAVLGVVALVGLIVGLAQLRSSDGNVMGMLLVAWVPIAIVAGWMIVFAQPHANPFRNHVRSWSNDLGIADVAHYVTPFVSVMAFGIGLVLGLTLLAGWMARRERGAVVEEAPAAAPETAPVQRRVVDEHVVAVPASGATSGDSNGDATTQPDRRVLIHP